MTIGMCGSGLYSMRKRSEAPLRQVAANACCRQGSCCFLPTVAPMPMKYV